VCNKRYTSLVKDEQEVVDNTKIPAQASTTTASQNVNEAARGLTNFAGLRGRMVIHVQTLVHLVERLLPLFMMFQLPAVGGSPIYLAMAHEASNSFYHGGSPAQIVVSLLACFCFGRASRSSIDMAVELGRSNLRISTTVLLFAGVLGGLSSFAIADTDTGGSQYARETTHLSGLL
jgi:MFS-type transporter involved in bile tolerance (Atg22 family)